MLQSSYKRASSQGPRYFSSPSQLPNASSDATMHTAPTNLAPAPDPLTRAFNDALKPYLEQIEVLQGSLGDANQQVQQLEKERSRLHAWIDKRGLRPDLPPALATPLSTSPGAAATLSTQLDRKMSMLNYSLHHLADSLASPLPASTVASSLSTLLPTIAHLSTLPSGSAFAFESLIKLAGNANSHVTGEESEADRRNVTNLYASLDERMVEVVQQRIEGGEEWDLSRDMARLEKTGAYLKKEIGLENYFKDALDAMRREGKWDGAVEGVTRYSDESR